MEPIIIKIPVIIELEIKVSKDSSHNFLLKAVDLLKKRPKNSLPVNKKKRPYRGSYHKDEGYVYSCDSCGMEFQKAGWLNRHNLKEHGHSVKEHKVVDLINKKPVNVTYCKCGKPSPHHGPCKGVVPKRWRNAEDDPEYEAKLKADNDYMKQVNGDD